MSHFAPDYLNNLFMHDLKNGQTYLEILRCVKTHQILQYGHFSILYMKWLIHNYYIFIIHNGIFLIISLHNVAEPKVKEKRQ